MDIVLNVNNLQTPIKRLKDCIKSKTLIYIVIKKPTLNINIKTDNLK